MIVRVDEDGRVVDFFSGKRIWRDEEQDITDYLNDLRVSEGEPPVDCFVPRCAPTDDVMAD